MANIRKPINNPLSGDGPAAKLPPLPVQAKGVMGARVDSTRREVPVEAQDDDSGVIKSNPRPLPLHPFPPLPGLNNPSSQSTPQEAITLKEEEEEKEESIEEETSFVSEDLYETDADTTGDEDYSDEEENLISEDEEELLRRIYFSGDPELASQTIYALLDNDDLDWQVLETLAANPSTPEEFLIQLSHNENDFVRQAVMENEAISDALYASFVNDPEVMVVAAFVENFRTTSDLAKALINHPDEYIKVLLKRSPLLTDIEKNQIRI